MQYDTHLSNTDATGHLGRSLAAVLAGLVTCIVTHTGSDAVMHATGVFPAAGEAMSGALFVVAATYRSAWSVLAGYVTAALSPHEPLKHALVLGGIGTALSLAGMLATMGRPEFGPLWYPLLLVVSALPCTWLGAKLRALRN